MNEEQFSFLNGVYREQPALFTERQADILADNAQILGLPFERDEEQGDFSLRRTISQLGSGFVQGFTTLNVGEDPENTVEGLARGLGSLLGFVGYIPGPGLAGRIGTSAVGRALGLGKAAKLSKLPQGLNVTSVPMLVANKVVRGIEGGTAASHAMSFLSDRSKDMVVEGLRLGTASAASAWQFGIDDMAKGFAMGAFEGAAFRGVSNFVKTGDQGADKVVRAASNAIFAGLPSTLRGDPLELQAYQYLLGTYFGVKELPLEQIQAMRFMQRGLADGSKDILTKTLGQASPRLLDPAGYDALPDPVKDELRQQAISGYGRLLKVSEELEGGQAVEGLAVFARALKESTDIDEAKASDIFKLMTGGLNATFAESVQKSKDPDRALEQVADTLPRLLDEMRASLTQTQVPIRARNTGDLERAVEDHDSPYDLTRPIDRIAGFSKMASFKDDVTAIIDSQAAVIAENPSRYDPEFLESMVDRVVELDPTLKDRRDEEIRPLLTRAIKEQQARLEKRDVYFDGTRVRSVSAEAPRAPDGKRIAKSAGPTHLDLSTAGESVYLSRFYKSDYGREGVSIFDEEQGYSYADFVQQIGERGYIPFAVRKDKGELVMDRGFDFEPSREGEARYVPTGAEGPILPADAPRYLKDRLGRMEGGDVVKAQFDGLKQEYIEYMKEQGVTTIRGHSVGDFYDMSVVHNIGKLEQANSPKDGPRMTFEEMAFGRDGVMGSFFKHAADLNARMQLITDGNYAPNPNFLRGVPAVPGQGEVLNLKLRRIISGGQTGADRAGLEAAKLLGLETGGTAPLGYRTEVGADPSLAEFGLSESNAADYGVRTETNVVDADATIVFGRATSPGSRKTISLAKKHGKPLLVVNKQEGAAESIRAFLNETGAQTLNVAGNRESKNKGIGEWVQTAIKDALDYDAGQSLADTGEIRFAILAETRTDGKPVAMGTKASSLKVYENGETKEVADSTHHDGGDHLLPEIFDALLYESGIDPSSGGIKGSMADASGLDDQGRPLGLMIGKLMFYRADEKRADFMRKNGLHATLGLNSAKAYGFRKPLEYYLDGKGVMHATEMGGSRKAAAVSPYTMKLEGLRVNASSSEDAKHFLHRKEAVKQIGTNIFDEATQKYWDQEYTEKAWRGDEALTKRALKSKGRGTIKIDDMGVEALIETLLPEGPMESNPLANDLLRQLVSKEHQDPDAEFDDALYNTESDGPGQRLAAVLAKTGQLTPATIFSNPSLEAYVMKSLRNYLVGRMTKPKVERGGAATIYPLDGTLQYDIRNTIAKTVHDRAYGDGKLSRALKSGLVPEGYFLAGEAMRGVDIRWLNDSRITLEKAWEQYNEHLATKGRDEIAKKMEPLLEMAAVRVPADSPSGTRYLRMLGFTGRPGAHMALNVKDQSLEGGADHDGDKLFWFHNLDKTDTGDGPIRQYFKGKGDQWVIDGGLRDSKEGFEDDFVLPDGPHDKGIMSQLDPRLNYETGGSSFRGNQIIGIPAIYNQKVTALFKHFSGQEIQGRRSLRSMAEKGAIDPIYADGISISDRETAKFRVGVEGKVSDSDNDVRAAIRAGVNFTADAAKKRLAFGANGLKEYLTSKVVDGRVVPSVSLLSTKEDWETISFTDEKSALKHIDDEIALSSSGRKLGKNYKDFDQGRIAGLKKLKKQVKEFFESTASLKPRLSDFDEVRALDAVDGSAGDSSKAIHELAGSAQDLLNTYPDEIRSTWYRALARFADTNPAGPADAIPAQHGVDVNGRRVVMNPAIANPWMAPAARGMLKNLTQQATAGLRDGDPEAAISLLLMGRNISIPDASMDYVERFKGVNDFMDMVTAVYLPVAGRPLYDRLISEEGATPGGVAERIRGLQDAWSGERRMGSSQDGFRRRLLNALALKRTDGMPDSAPRREGESLEDVLTDMTKFAAPLKADERAYFDALLLSTVRPQSDITSSSQAYKNAWGDSARVLSEDARISTDIDNAARLFAARPKTKDMRFARRWVDEYIASGRIKKGVRELSDDVDANRQLIRDAWKHSYAQSAANAFMGTGTTTPALYWDGIAGNSIANWARAVNQLADEGFALQRAGDVRDVFVDKDGKKLDVYTPAAEAEARFIVNAIAEPGAREKLLKTADEEGVFDPATEAGRANIERSRRLARILADMPSEVVRNLPELFSGLTSELGIGKSMRMASVKDVDDFISYFEDHKSGFILDRLFKGQQDGELPKLAYMFFPHRVGDWMMDKELYITDHVLRRVLTPDGLQDLPTRTVFTTIKDNHDIYNEAVNKTNEWEAKVKRQVAEEFGWLRAGGTNKDAEDLFSISTIIRELGNIYKRDSAGNPVLREGRVVFKDGYTSTEYWRRWKSVEARYNELVSDTKKRAYKAPLRSRDGGLKTDRKGNLTYSADGRNLPTFTNAELIGHPFTDSQGFLNTIITNRNKAMYEVWVKNERAASDLFVEDGLGGIDLDKTLDKLRHLARKGDPHVIGLDGLMQLFHEQQLIHFLPRKVKSEATGKMVKAPLAQLLRDGHVSGSLKAGNGAKMLTQMRKDNPFEWENVVGDDLLSLGQKTRAHQVGRQREETYWGHNGHDPKKVREWYKAMEKSILEGKLSERDKVTKLTELQRAYAMGTIPDDLMSDQLRTMVFGAETGEASDFKIKKPQPIRARGSIPMPGWDPTLNALNTYNRAIIKGYYDALGTLLSQHNNVKFRMARPMDKSAKTNFTEQWAQYADVYLNTFLGGNTMYPDSMLEGDSKLRGSAAHLTSDRKAWDLYRKFHKMIGGKRWQEIKDIEDVRHPVAQKFATELRNISSLEAKYQMMTLLANTRSVMNNLFGGNIMTAVSTGFRPWRKTFSINYLKSINPEWNSWADVRKWAEEHGAVESYIISEANLSGDFTTANAKAFLQDAMARFNSGKEVADSDLLRMARKHNLKEGFVNTSAWFMRVAERDLRLRSYMAHYIKALEIYGGPAANIDPNDPTILQFAKKGVENTQFLYHGTARPAFAASSLGKIFSRFQTWSWNSVRFRRDVYQSAKRAGFRVGTEEFKRFKQTAQADLFMMGLASMLPMTMFESTLPAPMNYLEDLSAFFFGDEEEREKAFYGQLPYPLNVAGIVLPPSARIFTALTAMGGGDIDRFVDYHLWTMMPFGPLARNIKNSMNNPVMTVDFMTGFPLHRAAAEIRDAREQVNPSPFGPPSLQRRDAA